jgi:hypothetical protein
MLSIVQAFFIAAVEAIFMTISLSPTFYNIAK